jgi:hypothetical protein
MRWHSSTATRWRTAQGMPATGSPGLTWARVYWGSGVARSVRDNARYRVLMAMTRRPARLAGLIRARAAGGPGGTGRHAGGMPGSLVLDFRDACGPTVLNDGRELRAVLTLAELAEVLLALPALTIDSDEDAAALRRVALMLRSGD